MISILIYLSAEQRKADDAKIKSLIELKQLTMQCVGICSKIEDVFITHNELVGEHVFRDTLLEALTDADKRQKVRDGLSHEWTNLQSIIGFLSLDEIKVDAISLPFASKQLYLEQIEDTLFFLSRFKTYLFFLKSNNESSAIILSDCGMDRVEQLGGIAFGRKDRPEMMDKIDRASSNLTGVNSSIVLGAFENLLHLKQVLRYLESDNQVVQEMRNQVQNRISKTFPAATTKL